ncbi:MAG: glycosyltransferase [Candidatus Omnitrophica bacterium]|nr:glycosyltransferase [Candidatus Omnitrophota bacterium]
MLISVIIPTYNKKSLLLKTLKCLERQTLPKNLYEILIIDDGSTDGTDGQIKKYAGENKNVKYFKKPHSGPGDSRNLGLKHARGEIIAFTDDDCVVPGKWLTNIRNSFLKNQGIAGIEGKTLTFFRHISPLTHQVINTYSHGIFPTCNMAYKKDILKKIGGFDKIFKHPHDEDIDLAWNALKYGEIIFDEAVIIIHPAYRRGILKKLLWTCHFKYEFTLYNRHKELYKKFIGANPWITIYINSYLKYNLTLLRKYIKNNKTRLASLYSLKIIIFLLLQGLLLIALAPYFLYWRKNK